MDCLPEGLKVLFLGTFDHPTKVHLFGALIIGAPNSAVRLTKSASATALDILSKFLISPDSRHVPIIAALDDSPFSVYSASLSPISTTPTNLVQQTLGVGTHVLKSESQDGTLGQHCENLLQRGLVIHQFINPSELPCYR